MSSDDGERARLEAIVFGRDATVSDAEREAAAAQLARVLEAEAAAEAERARESEQAARVAASVPPALRSAKAAEASAGEPRPASHEAAPDEPRRGGERSGWRRRVLIAAIAIAAVLVAGVAVRVLVFGWQPFGPTDSMAIFDRPQTERDLEFPQDFGGPDLDVDTVRFVGSDAGYDVYAHQLTPGELSPVQEVYICIVIAEGAQAGGGDCMSPAEFSGGIDSRFEHDGGWIEVTWDIGSSVAVTTGEHPPIASPLAVFDQEQDDADLNALAYLPDIPPSQQDTVRFLNSSGGYFVAAYRDADEAVCLAVYEGGTTLATSESACVTEAEFEADGIQLIYPADAPAISVTWGDAGVAFSGR